MGQVKLSDCTIPMRIINHLSLMRALCDWSNVITIAKGYQQLIILIEIRLQ